MRERAEDQSNGGVVTDSEDDATRVTPSRVTYRDDEFRFTTADTESSIKLIRSLPDVELVEAARGLIAGIRDRFPLVTNPSWIAAQCAEQAYDRGLIDEQELDWLTR